MRTDPGAPPPHRCKAMLLAMAAALLMHTPAHAGGMAAKVDATTAARAAAPPRENNTHRLIVKYRDASQLAGADILGHAGAQVAANRAGVTMRQLRRTWHGAQVIALNRTLPVEQVEQIARDLMAADPNIEYAEADRLSTLQLTPNDTRYGEQWHYFEATGGINLPPAWDLATGTGVVVAVIDSGYRPHADLAANILPGYDLITDLDTANDGNGRDADPQDPGDWTTGQCGNAEDSSWHGTHVAGTIAALTNNGSGVAGVAFDARVVPVRVMGRCGGFNSDIADAMIWASGGTLAGVPANANPARVINMSLGGDGSCSSTYRDAIAGARSRGTVLVVAAGNQQDDAANHHPANCAGVIAVAATTRSGGRASYSNFGAIVDIAAPGNSILSTLNAGATTPGADSFASYNGTSMAAPHVAGVVALMLSRNGALTPDEVEARLKSSARAFPASCSQCGAGIVDAAAAVQAAAGAANSPPTVAISAPLNGASFTAPASITVGANASDSDGTIAKVEFFAGSTLIGSDTSAPYSVAWSNVAAGSYSLTAKATDDKGASKTSIAIGVTVNAAANVAPTVSLTGPANGASYTAPASITLSANAADSDGTIAKVEFFAGGTLIGTDTSAPYSANWSNVAAGSYSLTARATDNKGAATTSGSVNVTVTGGTPVNAAPTISVTSPANGAAFTAPANVTINANAADSDGSVAQVELLQGGTVLATDTAAPYSFALNNLAAGSYSYTLRAIDNLGASASAALNITVNASSGGGAAVSYKVSSAYDKKNGKTWSSSSDPVKDLNSVNDQLYKVEVEQGSGYWWEINYADPASTAGTPSSTVVTLHVVPEESWTGTFTLQYLEGSTVLAQVNLPLDSRKDSATGKGQKLVYTWDLSAQVPGLTTLVAGKVRAINTGGNGKKVFVTYSLQDVQH
jgi:serine protease